MMNHQPKSIWMGLLLLLGSELWGQPICSLRGEASAWVTLNPGENYPLWMGARYIPQVRVQLLERRDRLLDVELSANIHCSGYLHPFDRTDSDGEAQAYRAWGRFGTNQLELRLGLQKINFGSSLLIRPLMWFDRVDPRDPLELTDGVWALLSRYYFLNNANIWLWGLYGNDEPKTWELGETAAETPEFGGRVQLPVPRGEAALTFHHRKVDLASSGILGMEHSQTSENRYGLDAKIDVEVGLWMEGTWINKRERVGSYTNQQILNLGTDYTFGLGNGLNVIWEQMLVSNDPDPFVFDNTTHLSAASLSYPVNVLDSISAIVYHDWSNKTTYAFINWKRQLNRLTFHLMAFRNPEAFRLPQQSEGVEMFTGEGVQVMVVFNH
jgi:hypothetical protein